MEVFINSKSLCHLNVSSMGSLYNLLGKHSINFHIEENQQKLNIISPVSDKKIYLEIINSPGKLNKEESSGIPKSFVNNVRDKLIQAGFEVVLIRDEEEKKRALNKQEEEDTQNLWLSLTTQEQGNGNGITAYFSFNQIRSSKQLANFFIQNIHKHTDLLTNGVLFDWKNIMNHLFPLSVVKHTMPAVVLSCEELYLLSNEQLHQLETAVYHAILTYYHQHSLLEIIQFCLAQEEKAGEEKIWLDEKEAENVTISAQSHHQNNVVQQDPSFSNASSKSPDPTTQTVSSEPNHSTYSLLYHQSLDNKDKQQSPKTISSFVAYMHILSALENQKDPNKNPNKEKSIDFLTLQNRK